MSAILKNCIDTDNNIDCKFSECARFIRGTMSGIIKKHSLKIELSALIKHKNYKRTKLRKISRCITRGCHKSIHRINMINSKIEEQDHG
jgi:hypothetical protein